MTGIEIRAASDGDLDDLTAFYRKHGAEDLNPHWLVWPDITVLLNSER